MRQIFGPNGQIEPYRPWSEERRRKHRKALALKRRERLAREIEKLDAKIAEFREASEARLKAERDSGLTACLERLEVISAEHDTAFDDLMAIKPTSVGEARRKIAAAMEPLTNRLYGNSDQEDIADILRALV